MATVTLHRDLFRPPVNRITRQVRVVKRLLAAVLVLIVLAGAGFVTMTALRWCGWHSGSTRLDGECVGLSDGSFTFDNPGLGAVGQLIKAENDRVAALPGSHYVKVALLSPLGPDTTGPMSTDNIVHAVEGAYLAQIHANHSQYYGTVPTDGDPYPQVQLILANEGNHEAHWPTVVHDIEGQVTGDHPIVGVVGLGVSWPETQSAVSELSAHRIPMVSATLSADDFTYQAYRGLVNVSPSNSDYVNAVAGYFAHQPGVKKAILMYDTNADLYTGTLRTDFEAAFAAKLGDSRAQPFTGSGRSGKTALFGSPVQNICAEHPDLVLFAGRPGDLKAFVEYLAGRTCSDLPHIVVVAGATGLSSNSLSAEARAKGVSMVFATSEDTEGWAASAASAPAGYATFLAGFEDTFGHETPASLTDGYVVMHYDSMLSMVYAARMSVPSDKLASATIDTSQVFDVMVGLTDAHHVVGATGTLQISDANGGRAVDKLVPVMRAGPDTGGQGVLVDSFKTPVTRSR